MSPYSERRLIQHAKQNIAQLSDGCPLQQSPSFFISLSKLTRRPESRIHSRGARRSLDSRPIPDDRSPSGGRPDRLAPDRSRPEGEPLGNTIGHSGPRHRSRHRPMVERNGVVFPDVRLIADRFRRLRFFGVGSAVATAQKRLQGLEVQSLGRGAKGRQRLSPRCRSGRTRLRCDIGGFRGLWQAGGILLNRYNRACLFALVPQFGLRFEPQLQPSGPSRSDKHHGVDSDQSDVRLPADSE